MRTGRYLFVRYASGEMELYDPSNDLYELLSLHNSAAGELKGRLANRLDVIEGSTASSKGRAGAGPSYFLVHQSV